MNLLPGDLNPDPYPYTPLTFILVEWPSHENIDDFNIWYMKFLFYFYNT